MQKFQKAGSILEGFAAQTICGLEKPLSPMFEKGCFGESNVVIRVQGEESLVARTSYVESWPGLQQDIYMLTT
jgi:hypothetical protein